MALFDVPLPLLIPIGAILAACITGAISFVTLVISKEQKTSEFRQAWIDGLRSELSDFASQARRVSSEETPLNLKTIAGSFKEQLEARNEEALRPDPFHENRQRMAQAYYALRLRLNPAESDNQTLLTHLDNIYTILNTHAESVRYDRTVNELDALACVAQGILKQEWTRVKEGEKRFQTATFAAKWTAIALGITFTILIAYAVWSHIHAT
jgi:hypothetical protein